jgi:ATP-dependent RNA helicase SUPV3L1/SUV3
MLNAQAKQFRLGDDGQVLYQADASNPLPGAAVARVLKGASILEPAIEITDTSADKETVEKWLKEHVATVLEPLVSLRNDETLQGAVKDIALKVYDAMGIVPREELESLIVGLDQETRRTLRGKKIRLGPVLVFQPDLNKPAAVRLRAVLWSLYNGKNLPAETPKDGVVSFKIDSEKIDRAFYQAVGYPVYGPRAIRIDMLDRVINAVYENAKDGKFQAKHEMAEWLGCNIEDLYAILSAMGHKKIYDPALNVTEEKPTEEKTEKPAEEATATPKPQVKPELATFQLKKGKAFEKQEQRAPRPPREKKERAPKESFKKGRAGKKQGKGEKKGERPERVISAVAKSNPEDSPFAILQQLKVKKDAG